MLSTRNTRSAQSTAAAMVCLLEFVFTLSWTVYVIFLPGLLTKAGIDKSWLLWILMLDQLVFAAMDVWMGFAADRMMRAVGRIGRWLLAMAGVSALAFMLMPWLSHGLTPNAQAPLLLALILVWVSTSSAMRAPPLVMLKKYTSGPQTPWLLTLYLTGLALAGALAPYLGVTLKKIDPALPFAVSSMALVVAVLGLLYAERQLGALPRPPVSQQRQPGVTPWGVWVVGLLIGVAFQFHFSLNAAKQFLQFSTPADLEWLMPVFWIGFNLILLATSVLTKRFGNLAVAGAGAMLGALGSAACVAASGLDGLIVAQLVTGAGWGLLLISVINHLLDLGGVKHEGLFLGGFFSVLALSAAARIAVVIANLPTRPDWGQVLPWSPALLWLTGGMLLLVFWRKSGAALAVGA